jgi:Transposase DDE domain group 1
MPQRARLTHGNRTSPAQPVMKPPRCVLVMRTPPPTVDPTEKSPEWGGDYITSDAGRLLLGATSHRPGRSIRGLLPRPQAPGPDRTRGRHFGRPADFRDCARLRRAERSRSTTPRPNHGGAGRQVDAESAQAESSPAFALSKIYHDPEGIRRLFVELFLETQPRPPRQIILDLDATDDPLHGRQGRFFHGYYCCYLPHYVFCARHLLAAKLRRSNIDAVAGSIEELDRISQIRARRYKVRVLLRADRLVGRPTVLTPPSS